MGWECWGGGVGLRGCEWAVRIRECFIWAEVEVAHVGDVLWNRIKLSECKISANISSSIILEMSSLDFTKNRTNFLISPCTSYLPFKV